MIVLRKREKSEKQSIKRNQSTTLQVQTKQRLRGFMTIRVALRISMQIIHVSKLRNHPPQL